MQFCLNFFSIFSSHFTGYFFFIFFFFRFRMHFLYPLHFSPVSLVIYKFNVISDSRIYMQSTSLRFNKVQLPTLNYSGRRGISCPMYACIFIHLYITVYLLYAYIYMCSLNGIAFDVRKRGRSFYLAKSWPEIF